MKFFNIEVLPGGNEADWGDRAYSLTRLMLLLGIIVFVTYPDIVLGSHAFVYRDAGLLSYPLAYYFKQCFLHGQWPLWNPYNCCGIPFLAQWNTMCLYPFSLFYLLLPMPWSMNYFVLAHVFLGAAGMYFLAWRWFDNRLAAMLAGLVFAWNGSSMDILMWPSYTAAMGWMPWVVLGCEKATIDGGRAVFWAALAGAFQMLTGAPETILCTWLVILPMAAARLYVHRENAWKITRRIAAVAGMVAALSAAQLLPWLDFVAHGDRSSATGGDRWSLPTWGAANFLVPLFRHVPSLAGVYWQPGQELYSSYYVGIVTVTLALLAVLWRRDRKTLILAVLAVGGYLCACGDSGRVLALAKKIAPWLGFSRYPVKFLVVTLFCLPLLAASGLAWLQARADVARARRALWPAAAIAALGIGWVLWAARRHPFPDESWAVTWQSGWSRLVFLLTAMAILFRRLRGLMVGFGLVIVTAADICTHTPRQNPTVPIQAYDQLSPSMFAVPLLGQSRARVTREAEGWMDHLANPSPLKLYLGQRTMLFKDCNLLELVPKVDGFFPVYLRDEARVADMFSSHEHLPRLEEFLGVSESTSSLKLFTWDQRIRALPMATIGQAPVFLDNDATLRALASGNFSPRQTVYLPVEASNNVAATADPAARVLSSRVTASLCEFETQASHPALLVVAQSWYHCWRAEIDGVAAPLLRANYAFQAVAAPAGRHVVRLVYQDSLFYAGVGVSLVSLLLVGLGLWRCKT